MDNQSEGNLSMNVGSKVNRSALLGDSSPKGSSRHNVTNLLEQQSMGGSSKYQPPQKYFKTEGQARMDQFLERLRAEQGGDGGNTRKSIAPPAGEDSDDSADMHGSPSKAKDVDASFVEKLGFRHNAPEDAKGCAKIQTMEQYVSEATKQHKNPKKQFFDLSMKYYTAKYDKNNKKTIAVKPYIITEEKPIFTRDPIMDIIQTNQGCMPIIKTFEQNTYTSSKYVKALKFYKYRTDCSLAKQFVVDDGFVHENFQNYDVSLLHYGNSILFYKREENWHKLMMYDVLTQTENELEGYQIAEPVGEDALRFHIIFAQEFNVQKSKSDRSKQDIHEFLKTKFVFAQTFKIQDQSGERGGSKINHQNMSLAMYSLDDTSRQLISPRYMPQKQQTPTLKEFGFQLSKEAIQWVGFKHDPENKKIVFTACDIFSAYQFDYRPYIKYNQSGQIEISSVSSYLGNNELQYQNPELITNDNGQVAKRIRHDIEEKQAAIENYCAMFNLPVPTRPDKIKDKKLLEMYMDLNESASINEKQWKMKFMAPFQIHLNPQFLIQKDRITVEINFEKKHIEQFFYITHDNQFMLIQPNYADPIVRTRVIIELAMKHRKHQISGGGKINFDTLLEDEKLKLYTDDFARRQKEFATLSQKKISHVCNDPSRSQNYMKSSDHLKMILDYKKEFGIHDKIILATDQEQSNIYVQKGQEVEIYAFPNNIGLSQKIKILPRQMMNIQKDEYMTLNVRESTKRFQADSRCYYINSKFNNLISSNTHVKSACPIDDDQGEMAKPVFDEFKNEVTEYDSKQLTYRVLAQDEQRFAIVEGKNGKYMNIRIKQDHNKESISFQSYTRNNAFYCLCFTLNSADMSKTYFFIKRTIREIEDLGNDNHQSLINFQEEQIIYVVLCNNLKGTKKDILSKYLKKMSFKQLQEALKDREDPLMPYKVHLTFETLYDMQTSIDFLPFIYQDQDKIESHTLLVMDIDKMQIVQKTCVNANLTLRKSIRKSEAGFSMYTLTRTSNVYNQKQGFFSQHSGSGDPSYQLVKYMVGSQFYVTSDRENPANTTMEFNEYLIRFSNWERNLIQLIGRKQLFISPQAMKTRKTSLDQFLIIPYFDKAGVIKGSQFILKEDDQQILLKDQDENNIFHQRTDLVAFGHQKFLTNTFNHDEYILIASCQFRQKVFMEGNFENNEAYYIMNKIQKKIMSQQLAKFEYFVLNDDFDELMRTEFYQPQEVLQGKSIFDLCLGFPKEIANGLKQEKEVYKRIDGSLIQEICSYDDKQLKWYLDAKLCEENLMVQIDFNFVSSLRLAMELNSNQAVKLMLQNVFKINSIEYQEMMMLDFPKFLQFQNIKRIYPFLERDYEEYLQTKQDQEDVYVKPTDSKSKNFCNFEEFMSHPQLPPFGSEQKAFHIKQNFVDFHNSEKEILQEMIDKDPHMTWTVDNFGQDDDKKKTQKVFEDKNVEVEHSMIDFQKLIIGEKIRDVQEDGFHTVNFNDQHLASIFCVEPDHQIDFYKLETVRKIVDYQFITTKWFLGLMLKFYLFGFLLPFLVSLSVDTSSKFILSVTYTMCFFTQIIFFIFEIIQFREQRLAYFQDMWNIVDTSQFIFFTLLYSIKMYNLFTSDTLFEIMLQGILLFQCFYKVSYFVRIYDSVAFILTLLTNICYEAMSFVLFLMCILIGFVKINAIFHVGYEDPSNGQLESDLSLRSFIVFMNTQGEITAPYLFSDMYDRFYDQHFMLFMIFLFITAMFIVQQLLFGLAGTFFIALVSQSYERQLSEFPNYQYKIKARFNEENFQILDMFQTQKSFKVLFFSFDKDLKSDDESKWLGATHAIKKSHTDQMNKQIEDGKKAEELREKDLAREAQTNRDITETLKLMRIMAKENQELKGQLNKLMGN